MKTNKTGCGGDIGKTYAEARKHSTMGKNQYDEGQERITPAQAFAEVERILFLVGGLGPLVVHGKSLMEYQHNIQIMRKILLMEPTAKCCLALESCIGLAFRAIYASEAYKRRPRQERKMYEKVIANVGVCCGIAGEEGDALKAHLSKATLYPTPSELVTGP